MAEEPEQEEDKSLGWERLTDAWFASISELEEIMTNAEDPRVRIDAAKTLLDYFKSFGQSLNPPWVPNEPTDMGDLDDDEDDDDD